MKSSLIPNAAKLRESLDDLESELADKTISSGRRRALETELQAILVSLGQLLDRLDPITQPSSVFDPSSPKIVGRFVSLALVAQARHPLSDIPRTYGSGVYAIYYRGDYPLYAPISGTETPIYVGQAAPASNHARLPREQGDKLSSRLATHKRNIGKANDTLTLDDFSFRSLVGRAVGNHRPKITSSIFSDQSGIARQIFCTVLESTVTTPRRALTSALLGTHFILEERGQWAPRRMRKTRHRSKTS